MRKLLGKLRPVRASAAVTGLLMIAVLLVWGVGMYCLTSVTAEFAAKRYADEYADFASVLAKRVFQYELIESYDPSIERSYPQRMWEVVQTGGRASNVHLVDSFAGITGYTGFIDRKDGERANSATAIFDGTGELLECSWWDFFYFAYMTEDQWLEGEEHSTAYARAFFDREKLTDLGKTLLEDGEIGFDAAILRFTGSYDGQAFTATNIECIELEAFRDAWYSYGVLFSDQNAGDAWESGGDTAAQVVERDQLPWLSLYEDPEALPPDAETVCFYSRSFDVCYHTAATAFQFKDKTYENTAALVAELGPALAAGWQNGLRRYEGRDLILTSVDYCFSVNGEIFFSANYPGENGFQDTKATLHFYTVSVVHCAPWDTAMRELRNVYIYTFLLALAAALVVCASIKRHLIQTVQVVGRAMGHAGEKYYLYPEPSSAWYESRLLLEGFDEYSDTLQMRKNEITRLQTALDYAKTAEETRRQMTSNIAHELKTPLAVVHSYAEGLKERIAEEKRDRYLDVILSETERMDGMVLEMLELSRLEAGKVKLARDQVSLGGLARGVFEKLELAVQAKGLRVEYELPADFTVNADESRIGQVIENFASNAVKYTPAGGRIWVKLQKTRSGVTFSIENESAPLSEAALGKVWDSFYRADEARSGGGTGLGLAIAKSIVELHGGKCFVRNTKHGVEFGFTM